MFDRVLIYTFALFNFYWREESCYFKFLEDLGYCLINLAD